MRREIDLHASPLRQLVWTKRILAREVLACCSPQVFLQWLLEWQNRLLRLQNTLCCSLSLWRNLDWVSDRNYIQIPQVYPCLRKWLSYWRQSSSDLSFGLWMSVHSVRYTWPSIWWPCHRDVLCWLVSGHSESTKPLFPRRQWVPHCSPHTLPWCQDPCLLRCLVTHWYRMSRSDVDEASWLVAYWHSRSHLLCLDSDEESCHFRRRSALAYWYSTPTPCPLGTEWSHLLRLSEPFGLLRVPWGFRSICHASESVLDLLSWSDQSTVLSNAVQQVQVGQRLHVYPDHTAGIAVPLDIYYRRLVFLHEVLFHTCNT